LGIPVVIFAFHSFSRACRGERKYASMSGLRATTLLAA
jgi:hypothetical protein